MTENIKQLAEPKSDVAFNSLVTKVHCLLKINMVFIVNLIQAGGGGGTMCPLQVFAWLYKNGLQ